MGRRHELAQLRAAVAAHRLVTLFGPGGVGKTRLALRAAADLSSTVRDGAWVVELAPVRDPELVPDTVVAALGLRDTGSSPPLERLVEHLEDREVLLVLDNCEHVEETAALLADQLLQACPELHILATSRHALGVPQEHLLPVPPLPVPAAGREVRTAEGLLHYDAVRLFVDRATAAWNGFEVSPDNQAALAELVRRLDGVPLAIELAAVRVRSLSVPQILDRLADRFALLSKGNRAALPRQQTLRALIDWSHDLLDPAERLLWARATVFSGSFDLEALHEVVCDADLPAAQLEGLVEGLVAKSILVREPATEGTAARFRMLESIEEYGARRLDELGTTGELRDRHRDHVAALADRAAREMYGPDGVAWFERLRADHDNVRAALEHCAARPESAPVGLRLMGALQHYWVMVGRFAEARRWLDRLLPSAESATGTCTVEVAAGLEVSGRLAVLQGDVAEGAARLDRALAAAVELGSTTWRAHALHGTALARIFWGDPEDAVPLLEEALALHARGEDPFGVPLALVQLATVHATLGDLDRAMARAEECLALSDAAGEQWCAGLARWTQAWVAWRAERPLATVRTYARDVLRLKEPFGDRLGMAMSLELLAWVDARDGRHEQAATLLGAADAALDSVGGGLFRHLVEDHDRCVAETTQELGPPAYDEAFQRGRALGFDAAVALALGRRSEGAPVKLTRREAEIAALVAEGLTNRAIAERLVVSPRTAEGHVARLLAKLGLTSRTQLAGWVREHGG